ncbi:MAG: hypothetical protein K1X79_08190 [Oligoflexia bacterium]|nr:hypothetical protein [Oligoflexia bacterium]
MSSSDSSKPEGRIDLGFSSLVAGASHQDCSVNLPLVQAKTPEVPVETKLITAIDSTDLPKQQLTANQEIAVEEAPAAPNIYKDLADKSAWEDLVQVCEEQLPSADSPNAYASEKLEARLWWVRAQLELGLLPLQILCAPIEGIVRAILRQGAAAQLRNFTLELVRQMANRSKGADDRAVRLSLLELAARLDEAHSQEFVSALREELTRLGSENSPSRAKRNTERRQRLESLEKEFTVVSNSAAQVLQNEKFVSNSALNEAAAPAPQPAPIQPEVARQARVGLTTTNRASSARAIIFGLLLVVALWGLLQYRNREQAAALGAFASHALDQVPPARLPDLERVARISNLDALFYDISTKPSSEVPVEHVALVEKKEVPSVAQPPVLPTSSIQQSVLPVSARIAGASVDTSGPIEPAALAEARAAMARGEREHLEGGASGRADDLFGSPNPRGDLSAGVRPMPVDKFSSEKTYVVITRTKVMTRPSFKTTSLAELEVGDRVRVSAQIGPWLLLRSKRGDSGYILAQDAELGDRR